MSKVLRFPYSWKSHLPILLLCISIGITGFDQQSIAEEANPVPAQDFINFESPHVHPLDMTPDGTKLLAVNTADNRLEVFEVNGTSLTHFQSISVGMDPITVRVRSNTEAWVANHIGDNVSIVDLTRNVVIKTLQTEDTPSDIVFAGSPQKAFVSCTEPSKLMVFDLQNLNAAPQVLTLLGEEPRALAVSPDGNTVYNAFFESGNQTAILPGGKGEGPQNGRAEDAVRHPAGPYGGIAVPPNDGVNFNPPMNPNNPDPASVSMIVKKTADGRWLDDNNGDWTRLVSGDLAQESHRVPGWTLLDHDIAVIDANSLSISYKEGMMNMLMALSVNPTTGRIAAIGTDATNEIRFEPVVQGTFLRVNWADVGTGNSPRIVDLNPHLDYQSPRIAQSLRNQSLGDPRGIVWRADGSRAYVTGMGSNNVIIINRAGARSQQQPINVGEGPTGIVLKESVDRAFVLNKFGGSISVLSLSAATEIEQVPFYDPTPEIIKKGRKHLYNTHETSGLGQVSCASCHVDARTDGLAWDLGNPAGEMTFFEGEEGFNQPQGGWHPIKGALRTMFLIDMTRYPSMHWRGDRRDMFDFREAFSNLQGADEALGQTEMEELESFLSTIHFPPNPYRNLDNSLSTSVPLPGPGKGIKGTGDAVEGAIRFFNNGNGCVTCHPGHRGRSARLVDNFLHEGMPQVPETFRGFYMRSGYWPKTVDGSTSGYGKLPDGSEGHHQDSGGGDDVLAFMRSFDGGVPYASPSDHPSQDAHAAVGKQVTVNGNLITSDATLLNNLLAIANTDAIGLVVKGIFKGEPRGFYYLGNNQYQSDRTQERYSHEELLAAGQSEAPLTFMAVPDEIEVRSGVDRDSDGIFDGEEDIPLAAAVNTGDIAVTAGDQPYKVYFNGVQVGEGNDWQVAEQISALTPIPGKNVLAIEAASNADGEMRIISNELMRTRGGQNWTDYTLKMEVGIEALAAGIVFRATDANNYYMWQLNLSGDLLRPHKRVNGSWTVMKEVPFDFVAFQKYQVEIHVQGNIYTTFIDGVQIDQTTDGAHTQGNIGFRQGGTREVGIFDDIEVCLGSAGTCNVAFVEDFDSGLGNWVNIENASLSPNITGMMAEARIQGQLIGTDVLWKVSPNAPQGWQGVGFNDAAWASATVYGSYGDAPWGNHPIGIDPETAAKWIWTENRGISNAFFRYTFTDNTVTPFVCQGDALLYEDFSGGLSQWEDQGVAQIINGALSYGSNDQNVSVIPSVGGSDWTDYTLSAKFRVQNEAAGLVFRYGDDDNFYMWQFNTLLGGLFRPHVRANGRWTVLKEIPIGLEEGVEYEARIEVEGKYIRTYLNEQLIDITEDESLTQGRIGFRQCEGCGESAIFDDIQVCMPYDPYPPGQILMERWDGLGDEWFKFYEIPLQNSPNSTQLLDEFSIPANAGDGYAARVRGYISPPTTGDYTFWIAADKAGELWLSTDENPVKMRQIAHSHFASSPTQWNRHNGQQSEPISLVKGKRYYVEAIMKESTGTDHLIVRWQKPGGIIETPIPGTYLSPYDPSDELVPDTPLNFIIESTTSESIKLSWDHATDNQGVAGYYIYQNGGTQPIATLTNASSATLYQLTPETDYSFTIAAFDGEGNLSPLSPPLSATTLSSCEKMALYEDDIERETGIWKVTGKSYRLESQSSANSGFYSINIVGDDSLSYTETYPLDLSAYEEIAIDFSFKTWEYLRLADALSLYLSQDGGTTFELVEKWDVRSGEVLDTRREFKRVAIKGPFSKQTVLRFSANVRNVRTFGAAYLDDISIEVCKLNACAGNTNLALNRSARMSSQYGNGSADLAVDGNTTGTSPWSADLMHTNNEAQPWWEVDLGAESQVNSLNIFNRTNGNQARLKNFYVLTSDAPMEGSLESLLASSSVNQVFYPYVAGSQINFPVNLSGRYLRIQLSGTDVLHFAEAQVIGCNLEQICETPLVSIDPAGPFNEEGTAVQLVASPAGGLWSGDVNGAGVFDPTQGVGSYEVIYTYEEFAGCVGADTLVIDVLPAGSICEAPLNLALGKTASQSSTYGNGEAGLAVDGNTTGTNAWSADLQHTTNEARPWWQVDLGLQSRLNEMVLYNRSDNTFNRLQDFYILVSDEPIIIKNLALNKLATQSSTRSQGGAASRAVDGNTNGMFWDNSVSHTNAESNVWWRVDLGQVYNLTEIKIFNRTDCCAERLNGFKLYIGESGTSNPSDYTELASLQEVEQQEFDVMGQRARYVFIHSPANQVLSLAEVQVFGYGFSSSSQASSSVSQVYFPGVAGFVENISLDGITGRYVRIQLSGTNILHLSEVEIMGCAEDGSCIDPIVSIESAGPFTADAGLQQLVGSPAGGTWSGAVSATGIFDPSQGIGSYEVIYTYTDAAGCGASAISFVEVIPGGCEATTNLALGKVAEQSSTYGNGMASVATDGNTSGTSPWSADLAHTNNEAQPWWQVDLGAVSNIQQVNLFNRTDCCQGRLRDFHIMTSNQAFSATASLDELLADPAVQDYYVAGAASIENVYNIVREARYIRIQLSGSNILHLAEVQVLGCASENDPCFGEEQANIFGVEDQTIGFGSYQLSANPAGGTWSGDVTADGLLLGTSCPGSYEAIYTYDNGSGCVSTDTAIIAVKPEVMDIFLYAGQSNATGAQNALEVLEIGESPVDAKIAYAWNIPGLVASNGWESLQAIPVEGNRRGHGAEISFGRTLFEAGYNNIGIIKVAKGGTNLANHWDPNSTLSGAEGNFGMYPELLKTVNARLAELDAQGTPYRIAGLLWHQGEGDMNPSMASIYETNLQGFITAARNDFGADLKVFIASVYNPYATVDEGNLVRKAQRDVAAANARTYVVNIDSVYYDGDFNPNSENLIVDNLHYNSTGQVKIGASFANTLLTFYPQEGCEEGGSGNCANPENLALGKFAEQSSTYGNGVASIAVDGNRNGSSPWSADLQHTTVENQPWWQVDLGEVSTIDQVNIYNRTDCCAGRLNNFYILVSDSPFDPNASLDELMNDPSITEYNFSGNAGLLENIVMGTTGRYLRIQHTRNIQLHMAEVEVIGCQEGTQANRFASANATEEAELASYAMRVYPNPSAGQLTIDIDQLPAGEQVNYSLYTLQGQQLWQLKGTHTQQADFSHLAKGVYLLRAEGNGWNQVKQIMIH